MLMHGKILAFFKARARLCECRDLLLVCVVPEMPVDPHHTGPHHHPMGKCLKASEANMTRRQRRHHYDINKLIVLGSTPIRTRLCRKCSNYRTKDDRILNIHEVLYIAADGRVPSPALPPVEDIIVDDVLTLPMELAVEISRAFKKSTKTMSFPTFKCCGRWWIN